MTGTGVPLAGRREWIALAVIALPCLLYSMDLSVLYLALPSLTADLRPSSAGLLWITDIYGFMIAGFLITMGTLGDRIGRRRLMLIGAAAFGAASVLAAFASSVAMLIAARALMGAAAATLAPSTLSLIRNMFLDPRQRTVAISRLGRPASRSVRRSAPARRPAAAFLLVGLGVPDRRAGDGAAAGARADAAAGVPQPRRRPLRPHQRRLSLVSVLALVYGVKELAQNGFGPGPAVPFLAGAGRRRRIRAPPADSPSRFVPLRLFRMPAFTASLAANTLSLFLIFGSFFLTAQYLQLVLGLSPLAAGAWSMPPATGFIAGS